MKTAIRSFLRAKQGRFFSIKFIKTDGTIRVLNGRTGVNYNGKPAVEVNEFGNLVVWEAASRSFKSIRPDSVLAIHFDRMIATVRD